MSDNPTPTPAPEPKPIKSILAGKQPIVARPKPGAAKPKPPAGTKERVFDKHSLALPTAGYAEAGKGATFKTAALAAELGVPAKRARGLVRAAFHDGKLKVTDMVAKHVWPQKNRALVERIILGGKAPPAPKPKAKPKAKPAAVPAIIPAT